MPRDYTHHPAGELERQIQEIRDELRRGEVGPAPVELPALDEIPEPVEIPAPTEPADDSDDNACVFCPQPPLLFPADITLPCWHVVHRECLIFDTRCNLEIGRRPRCCNIPIPVGYGNSFLTLDEHELYGEIELEGTTLEKTYCSNSDCCKFIPPYDITENHGTCFSCGTVTCTTCKFGKHDGEICLQDPLLPDILEMAKSQGWQRCYKCKMMIELVHGCFLVS